MSQPKGIKSRIIRKAKSLGSSLIYQIFKTINEGFYIK